MVERITIYCCNSYFVWSKQQLKFQSLYLLYCCNSYFYDMNNNDNKTNNFWFSQIKLISLY